MKAPGATVGAVRGGLATVKFSWTPPRPTRGAEVAYYQLTAWDLIHHIASDHHFRNCKATVLLRPGSYRAWVRAVSRYGKAGLPEPSVDFEVPQ